MKQQTSPARHIMRAVCRVLALFASLVTANAVWAAGAALPAWPSNRDGIVLEWENGKAPAFALDPDGAPIGNYFLLPKGLAWLDSSSAMLFQNGVLPLERGREHILSQLKKTNRMSVEAVITTLYATPYGACNAADKPIISFATNSLSGNFLLTQGAGSFRNNGMLSIFLQTAAPGGDGSAGAPLVASMSKVDLCYLTEGGMKNKSIGAGKPMHIIVTYEPGLLICYADGKKVAENRSVQGDFRQWTMHPFVFAGADPASPAQRGYSDRRRHWGGILEDICVYDRVLGADEAAGNYAACKDRLAARKPVARLKVQGKLLAKSAAHTAAQITPYRNELAVYEYEVEKVLSGDYKEKKIRVAQWVLMDGVTLAQAQAAVGKSCTLEVEAFDDHPQFGSERQSDTLPLDAGLTRYVDVGLMDETPVDPEAVKAAAEARQAREAARKKTPIALTQVAPNLLKLTGGARMKIVWMREAKPDPKRAWSGEFGHWEIKLWGGYECWDLMVFDTQEGKERALVPGPAGCGNPWITYDGSRVLFTDAANHTTCVMDWDGRNRRIISRDRYSNLLCYLRDAQTGIEWAYVNDGGSAESPPGYDAAVGSRVCRIQVDDPSVRETVWVGEAGPFRVSADGKYAGGEFGQWPKQYLANLAEHKLDFRGTGCQPRLAPDNSRRLFMCDGQHQNVILCDGDGSNARKITLMGLRPEFYSCQAALVNWANDVRFLALSAPIPSGDNLRQADIYVGRFNEPLTAVADLVQVSDSPVFNNQAFAWVEPKDLSAAKGLAIKALRRTATELPPGETVAPSAECRQVLATAASDWVSPATGMKFKQIPAGSFTAGGKGLKAHKPHEIKITRPFQLGVFVVTQEEWEKVMGSNPSDFKGPTLPVESVSWFDAQEFLKRLSEKDKVTYRLPTDAEWEYACRAGTATEYYWKTPFDGAYAWAGPNSGNRTHEVGTRLPNAWGLYDMSGNVFEWTSDSYAESKAEPQTDPSNPVDLKKDNRVDPIYRGGAFSSDAEYCCSGARVYASCGLNYRSRSLGFRVVRDVGPGK